MAREGYLFEVISKGKVAQHFEKGVVARRNTHVFNIVRSDAFLG